MKLSSYRRIYKQDFDPQYANLVDSMATTINSAFEEIYDALNNKLNFTDNINCTIASFDATVDADGVPSKGIQFKLNESQSSVEGLLVLSAFGSRNPNILPTGGVSISFNKNEQFIIIKNIKGLQTNIPYKIKVLALG